jgi:hypothetical protein
MRCRQRMLALLLTLSAAQLLSAQNVATQPMTRPVARLGLPRVDGPLAPAPILPTGYATLRPLTDPPPAIDPPQFTQAPPPFTPPLRQTLGAAPQVRSASSAAEAVLHDSPRSSRNADTAAFQNTSFFGERLRERFEEWMRPGYRREVDVRRWFLSDHEFDYFASPVSMPFLLEDPRSLTELRPVFIMQGIPNGAPNFQGGHIEFYGTQIRVAFTERFSFVMTKLGFIDINPGSGSTQPGGFGFAEVHLGPKFTFIRHQDTCLLAAAGLNFQIPSGPARVYQDTGRVSLVPYVTFGKNFLESRFGSLNIINTTGYSFSGDGERSDYLYNSFHLDWDIANKHKIYPMVELHYVQYTFSGGLRNLNVEGRDLANIGDVNSGGRANLNIAGGLRYKLTEAAQIGFAAEFPLNSRRDLQQFRFTIDLILRY